MPDERIEGKGLGEEFAVTAAADRERGSLTLIKSEPLDYPHGDSNPGLLAENRIASQFLGRITPCRQQDCHLRHCLCGCIT
jgi:hypothetical protein